VVGGLADIRIVTNDVMFGGGIGSEGRWKCESQRPINIERPSPIRAPQPQWGAQSWILTCFDS